MSIDRALTDFTRRDWDRTAVDGSIDVAVTGVGNFARRRAIPAIADSERCELTVLVAEPAAQVATLADRHDVDHVVGYDDFLDGAHVAAYDALYIAAPNDVHGEYAKAAAAFGKHVLCEKPLETSAERAKAIVDACADADVTLMVAYRLQIEPAIRRTRDLVQAGAVGDIVQIHGSFSNTLLDASDADNWRLDADSAGGGALVDLGIYPLNSIRFCLDAEPSAVYATTQSTDPPFADVDAHAAFQLAYDGETTASCTASFDAHARSVLEFVGTRGMIEIESPFGGVVPQELTVERDDISVEYTGPPIDEVREEFDYFGYCVLTGTDPEPDGEDGLADLRIIEAAYESAETGSRVSLE